MDKFVVSARKYRPSAFDTVVGQSHISDTLKNAIRNNHLAHAFLFCGPRGVGKTTCARILAKTINCETPTEDMEACGTCSSCKAFQDGASLNIYELDAASNNHVDDIRRLIDQVRYTPQTGTYKIYIIDEVHMLSQAAFNAFLKTLEEPPPYAKFILATTEKHKIIPTILSRCQIFDFHRIAVDAITAHLEGICNKEEIEAEKDALHIIAQKADGALRDALSIFDRIVSFAGKKVSYQDVIANLNILDYDYFFKVSDYVLSEDVAGMLNIFNEISAKGFDGDDFMLGLSEHFRNLLVCKDQSTLDLLDLTDGLKDKYINQSANISGPMIVSALNIANQCDIGYKASKNKRLHIEMALIKMCYINATINTDFPALVDAKKKTSVLAEDKKTESNTSSAVTADNKSDIPPKKDEPVSEAKDYHAEEAIIVPPVEVDKPKVKPSVLKPSSKKMSFKLSAIEDEKEIEEVEISNEITTDESVKINEKVLTAYWQAYSDHLSHEENGCYLSSMLGRHIPKVKNYNVFQVDVAHELEYEQFIENKLSILTYLRKAMNIPSLEMDVTISEVLEASNLAYTSRDKYKIMLEKNPALDLLKDQLDMEIEY